MTLIELEKRLSSVEKKVAQLSNKLESNASTDINAWIEKVRGTFQDDEAYRDAARLGREWRESFRPRASRKGKKPQE